MQLQLVHSRNRVGQIDEVELFGVEVADADRLRLADFLGLHQAAQASMYLPFCSAASRRDRGRRSPARTVRGWFCRCHVLCRLKALVLGREFGQDMNSSSRGTPAAIARPTAPSMPSAPRCRSSGNRPNAHVTVRSAASGDSSVTLMPNGHHLVVIEEQLQDRRPCHLPAEVDGRG